MMTLNPLPHGPSKSHKYKNYDKTTYMVSYTFNLFTCRQATGFARKFTCNSCTCKFTCTKVYMCSRVFATGWMGGVSPTSQKLYHSPYLENILPPVDSLPTKNVVGGKILRGWREVEGCVYVSIVLQLVFTESFF